MTKKTWILVKRGLLDPKHRVKFGANSKIWVYFHILDRANWEDGIVYDWRDKDEAEDMSMSWRTLQKHRQGLEEEGYILCNHKGDHQEIKIMNWVNPREYTGKVYNETPTDGGTQDSVPHKSTHKSTHKSDSRVGTLTLYSQITYQLKMVEAGELFEALFSEVSHIPLPDWNDDDPKVLMKRWRRPLWRMYKLTGMDARKTGDTIKDAVKQMRQDKLTISAPQSIEKVFTDIYARQQEKPEMDYA